MYCPICKNKADGKVCKYCGAVLEIDRTYDLNPYEAPDETPDTSAFDTGSIPLYNKNQNSLKEDEPETKNQDSKKTKTLVITMSVIITVIIALIVAIIIVAGGGDDKPADKTVELTISEELKYKAEKYMDAGDYDAAEKAYKELLETSADDETATAYKILYNYNRAVRSLDEYDFEEASKFFEKIPLEYTDYAIYDDVEILGDEIARSQTAHEIFKSIENFIAEKNYPAAAEAIDILDEEALSKENKESLKEFKEEIARREEKEIVLSQHDAEDLLMGYCYAMIKAINENNFDLVSPYIHKDSPMFAEQKKLVEKCSTEGIKEKFDSFKLVSLAKASDNIWKAEVNESETITYANGESETKNFNWTYTIEYIDSAFYLTGIK